ncbi:MAG: NADH:flavin oxidoreductase [Methanoregula sp.]|jgi:2,4-dienoyl-CoA reductase-like NADH-dependent reductase (Old Yellow Enzyme family)
MKTLFDETVIGTMRLKNRLFRSATWEAMADKTGRPTPRLIEVYRDLAKGGVGLVITSATTIAQDATGLPGMLSFYDDASVPTFAALAAAVHENGCPVVQQLTFVGAGGSWWTPGGTSQEDLRYVIRLFADAAARAQQAGFDGVQVHSGHGYFASQFLNAKKNTRSDAYGGSVENRARLLAEICDAIRARTGPSFNIMVKINCSDFEEEDGVWDACRAACRILAGQGISAIEVTGGTTGRLDPTGMAYDESVFRDYAAEIANDVDVPVILVGLNRTPGVLQELLETTRIGYFSLSRPLLREPDLPQIWKTHPDQPAACTSCDSCRVHPEGGISCPFREE